VRRDLLQASPAAPAAANEAVLRERRHPAKPLPLSADAIRGKALFEHNRW